jgi:branched-chain amino acid aminotransferase
MTIHGYRLSASELIPLDLNASTLDEFTGRVSDGFYTTFSTLAQGTRVLGLRAHLKRLYQPAQEFGLHPSADEQTLRIKIAELAKSTLPKETRIRLILTKDTGDVYIGTQPLVPPSESVYRDGVHVITADMARHDPRIKGTDFITQSTALRALVKGDVYEILLVHEGKILEGMTSNFYAVKNVIASRQAKQSRDHAMGLLRRKNKSAARNDGVLVTAQKGILLGVTRRAVLRLTRGEGMSIDYRAPRVDEDFDEAFLTSSSRGVVPIVRIDGKPVGQGRVGGWAKALSLAYQAYVAERSEKIVK